MTEEEEKKFWAQMIRTGSEKRTLKGGHGVPLSGMFCQRPIAAEVPR